MDGCQLWLSVADRCSLRTGDIVNILPRKNSGRPSQNSDSGDGIGVYYEFLPQDLFLRTLCRERKRTERSRRPFGLMLLRLGNLGISAEGQRALSQVVLALCGSTRETDVKGWYQEGSVIGIVFTELIASEAWSVQRVLTERIQNALSNILTTEQIRGIGVSFHIFPQGPDDPLANLCEDLTLYPDLQEETHESRGARLVKRAMDICGSLMILVLVSALLIVIAIAVKATSKGPLLFRQERLGQYGRRFIFLKFRSMYYRNDDTIHEEYVRQFILGKASCNATSEGGSGVYKLTKDPRVTSVGRLLRRTSMDELPQLFNVLLGDMSLVGPRPAVHYEFASYDIWHRRRLLEAKPGITGLWQVAGRSRIRFDDMVRLDLKYARSQSFWLDTKILLQTPRAVFSGEGAY